jgi:hypothetical protein
MIGSKIFSSSLRASADAPGVTLAISPSALERAAPLDLPVLDTRAAI